MFSITSLLTSVIAQENSDVKKLQLKINRYTQAVEKYDTAFFERFFDNSMVLTSTNGSHRNKQEEINDLLFKIPGLTLEYFVADSLKIILFGKTAIIAGVLSWKFKEQTTITKRSFTFTCINKHGWRIIAQHIGKLAVVNLHFIGLFQHALL